MTGKLRHIAISVPDPWKAAEFYMASFGMTKVGEVKAPAADGVYLTDGTINLALLRYKEDEWVGEGKTKDWFGVHHIGFWVDDTKDARDKIEAAGAKSLATKDAATLGRDLIYSVTNPLSKLIGAIHVYGGDFFRVERSEWDPESHLERAYDMEKNLRLLETN